MTNERRTPKENAPTARAAEAPMPTKAGFREVTQTMKSMSGHRVTAVAAAGFPQHGPLDVGEKIFAADFATGQPLDGRAVISREGAFSIPPETHGLVGHIEMAGQLGRASDDLNSTGNCVHAQNSTLVELEKSTTVFLRVSTNV